MLYTAKNNGEENNGGDTTMVTTTTVANNRIGHGDIWSVFPSFCYGVDGMGIWMELILEEGGLPAVWWDIQGIA